MYSLHCPKKSVYILTFFVPFTTSRVHGSYFLELLLLFLFVSTMLLTHLYCIHEYIFFKRQYILIYLFFLYIIAHVILWMLSSIELRNLKLLFFYILVPFLINYFYRINYRFSLKTILKCFFWGCSVYYSIILLTFLTSPHFVSVKASFGLRLLGIGGSHPAFFTTSLPLYLGSFLYLKDFDRKYRFSFHLGILLSILVIVLSVSRAALLSFLLVFSLYFILRKGSLIKKGVILIAILLLASAITTYNLGTIKDKYLTRTLSTSLNYRLLDWLAAVNLFKDNPVFGIGYGSFLQIAEAEVLRVAAMMDKSGKEKVSNWQNFSMSGGGSIFILYLCETGLIGFSLLVVIIITATINAINYRKAQDPNNTFLLSWLIFLIHLGLTTLETNFIFWFFLCYLLSLRKYGFAIDIIRRYKIVRPIRSQF